MGLFQSKKKGEKKHKKFCSTRLQVINLQLIKLQNPIDTKLLQKQF